MIFREGFKVDCIDILFQGKSTGWPGLKYHYYVTIYMPMHSSEFRGTNCSAAHTRVEVHNINYVPIAQSLKFRDKST